jgi:excisionase family DNA binding protein
MSKPPKPWSPDPQTPRPGPSHPRPQHPQPSRPAPNAPGPTRNPPPSPTKVVPPVPSHAGHPADFTLPEPSGPPRFPARADALLGGDRLLTAAEVARMFGVKRPVVAAWVAAGWITATRTPGGHLRFRESEVRLLLEVAP